MTKISLKQFIDKTKGTKVDVPWGKGKLKGQCVSLVQQYIGQCLGQPMKPRGNAKDWTKTYVNEGLGKITKNARYGDIIVYDIGEYGHIAIYIDSSTMYDQNNGYHDNYRAGYGVQLKCKTTYLRPNAKLIPDDKEYWVPADYKLLKDKALRKTAKITTNIYKVKECSLAVQKYLTSKKPNDSAYLKKDTDIKISKIQKEGKRVWGLMGKYWIVLCNKDGTKQATKL